MQVIGDGARGGGTVRVLDGFLLRLRGLLGTGRDASPVLVAGCSSIHTVGMRYPIDVAFVDERGRVLRVCREVPPLRLRWQGGAVCVVERPSEDGLWLKAGDCVSFTKVGEGEPYACKGSVRLEWDGGQGGGEGPGHPRAW